MEATALAQPASDRFRKIASPVHTIVVLAALAGWSFSHKISADHLKVGAHPDRVRSYLLIIFVEWLLFTLTVAGVWRSRPSVVKVLGDHWHSVREVLRNIGIAVAFWIVAAGLLWLFGWILGIHQNGPRLRRCFPMEVSS